MFKKMKTLLKWGLSKQFGQSFQEKSFEKIKQERKKFKLLLWLTSVFELILKLKFKIIEKFD